MVVVPRLGAHGTPPTAGDAAGHAASPASRLGSVPRSPTGRTLFAFAGDGSGATPI
jgi:hypothetical protein